MANSRLPDFVRGDLWAQVAASRKAEQRIRELIATYGLEAYRAAIADLFEEGERRSRAGLAALPHGRYPDRGGAGRRRDLARRDHGVGRSAFSVDLSGNPKQRNAPYNTSRDGAVISCQMIFKALTDPSLFANAGSFRALEVITEPGTIFHAEGSGAARLLFRDPHPARPTCCGDAWRRRLPERLPAGHFASICGTVIAGDHPDTGRRFTMVEPQMGGWGATATRDGLDAMYSTSHGDTFNCPVEICEARYGIDVGYKRLNESDGGQGPASAAARDCRSATGRAAAPCCRPATAATASRSGARPAARWRHQRPLGACAADGARGPRLRQRRGRRARRRDRDPHGQWRRLGPAGLNRRRALFPILGKAAPAAVVRDIGGVGQAGRLDQKAFRRGAVVEQDGADAERRRDRGDEAAEGRRIEPPDLDVDRRAAAIA